MENNYKEQLKNICKKYNFKYREYSENKISLCAKDIEQHWKDWITLNLATKDMTPDRIIEFVADINTMLRKFNKSYMTIKSLIDPEDWQELANIEDAYKDNRYEVKFEEISFSSDNYIYFVVEKEEYVFDGLFRIHDPANGNDMTLISISECVAKEDQDFFNAHWEEIENELCNCAKERQNITEETEETL